MAQFRKWLVEAGKTWGKLLAGLLIGTIVIALVINKSPLIADGLSNEKAQLAIAIAVSLAFLAAAVVLMGCFFVVFKGIEADAVSLNRIIVYCYAFVVFALSASLVPFIFFPHVPGLVRLFETSSIGILKGCSVKAVSAKEDRVPHELRCDDQTDQWVVNIGGVIDSSVPSVPEIHEPKKIQGGLIIPLYVVVLSLMGASVSMTRRVPEFQRRLSPGDPEYITYGKAREGLVFQIMQVASAPMIAMTVYYVIDPGSRATTIILAFASGFSSETILLLIRAFLEKLQPESVTSQGRVHVGVAPARLDFGDARVGAQVTKSMAITNPTAVDLDIIGIGCTGEYTVMGRPPSRVPAGGSAHVDVTFAPQSPGSKVGVLTVTDNAPGSPRAIDLTGTALP